MITPTLEELMEKGFEVLRKGTPPEYLGGKLSNGAYILAKHLIDDKYEIHTAKDSRGRRFDTIQLNCTDLFSNVRTFTELVQFLESPDYSKLTKRAA